MWWSICGWCVSRVVVHRKKVCERRSLCASSRCNTTLFSFYHLTDPLSLWSSIIPTSRAFTPTLPPYTPPSTYSSNPHIVVSTLLLAIVLLLYKEYSVYRHISAIIVVLVVVPHYSINHVYKCMAGRGQVDIGRWRGG